MADQNPIIEDYFRKLGRKGGKARMLTMSPEERSKRARKASKARWKKQKKS